MFRGVVGECRSRFPGCLARTLPRFVSAMHMHVPPTLQVYCGEVLRVV